MDGGAPRAIGEVGRSPRVRPVAEPEIARRDEEATGGTAKGSCGAGEGCCVSRPLVSSPVWAKVGAVGFAAEEVGEDMLRKARRRIGGEMSRGGNTGPAEKGGCGAVIIFGVTRG